MSPQLANTLETLIQSLETTLGILQGEGSAELHASLHDHNKLPDKELAAQAGRAVDLLHITEQLLSPGTLILADHFLGGNLKIFLSLFYFLEPSLPLLCNHIYGGNFPDEFYRLCLLKMSCGSR